MLRKEKQMKKVLTVLGMLAVASSFGDALSPYDLGCKDARATVASKGKLELGQWYTDWDACKTYADAKGLPVLFIWSNKTCSHCRYTDLVFVQSAFKSWQSSDDQGKVIYCFMAGGESSYPDQSGSDAYNWMYKGTGDGGGKSLDAYPFVVLWWKSKGVNVRYTGDEFCSGSATGSYFDASTHQTEDSLTSRVPNVIAKMESAFSAWTASDCGGDCEPEEPQDDDCGGDCSPTEDDGGSDVKGSFDGNVKHVFVGLVRDRKMEPCGLIQVTTAKATAKGVKVSGFVMLEDGKKATMKAVTVAVEKNQLKVSTTVGKLGGISLTIGGKGFDGTLGDMKVATEKVGEDTGILKATVKMSYFEGGTGKLKSRSVKLTGITVDGAAAGTLTTKGRAAKDFVAEIK